MIRVTLVDSPASSNPHQLATGPYCVSPSPDIPMRHHLTAADHPVPVHRPTPCLGNQQGTPSSAGRPCNPPAKQSIPPTDRGNIDRPSVSWRAFPTYRVLDYRCRGLRILTTRGDTSSAVEARSIRGLFAKQSKSKRYHSWDGATVSP